MISTVIFFFTLAGLVASVMHSYYKRGFFFTFNFFLFLFMVTLPRVGVFTYRIGDLHLSSDVRGLGMGILYSFIWLFVFYQGWCLSEKIINIRLKSFENMILPTVFLGGLAVGIMTHPLDFIAAYAGWWGAQTPPAGLRTVIVWGGFAMSFFAPFFIITSSYLKTKDSRLFLFFLPFLYVWLPLVTAGKISQFMTAGLYLTALFILAMFLNLEFDNPDSAIKNTFSYDFPLIAVTAYMVLVVIIGFTSVKDPQLYFRLLPLVFVSLLAVKRINFKWIAVAVIATLVMFLPHVGLLLPAALVFTVFKIADSIRIRR